MKFYDDGSSDVERIMLVLMLVAIFIGACVGLFLRDQRGKVELNKKITMEERVSNLENEVKDLKLDLFKAGIRKEN